MEDGAGQGKETPTLHRDISHRGMKIFFAVSVVIALFFFLLVPTCHTGHDPRPVVDMSNLRQILMVYIAYATDNNGRFPEHIHLAEEYLIDDSVFVSPYDQKHLLDFDKMTKPGWYQYGSYWFLSTDQVTFDSDVEATSVVLAYRTPREGFDLYIVGFFDGSVQALDEKEFDALMSRQVFLRNAE
ncbi:MAG: hypothetical protein AAGI37_10450 [Planctomycetota bacterium]